MNSKTSMAFMLVVCLLAASFLSALGGTVTGMICQDSSCSQQCNAFSSPTDTCYNGTIHRCGRNGICMDLRLFSHENCFGDVFENHRVSGECLGDEQYGYNRLTYLTNDIVEIHGNCSDHDCRNCNIIQRLNTETCFNYYGISGTLENLAICNYVVFDKFSDASCSTFNARYAVQEDMCYIIQQSQSFSAHCERGDNTAIKGTYAKKQRKHPTNHRWNGSTKKLEDGEGKNFLRQLGFHA